MIEKQSLTQLSHEMACNRLRNLAMALNVNSKVPTSTILQNKVNPVIGLKPQQQRHTHSSFKTRIFQLWTQFYSIYWTILNIDIFSTQVNPTLFQTTILQTKKKLLFYFLCRDNSIQNSLIQIVSISPNSESLHSRNLSLPLDSVFVCA